MDVALTKYNLPSREKLIGEGEEKWTRCFVTLLDLVEGDVSAETKERAKQKFNEVRVRKSKLFRIIMRVIIQGHLEGKEVKIGNTPLEMGDKKIKLNRADIHLPNECLKVFEGLINSLPSLEIKKVPKGQSDCYLL